MKIKLVFDDWKFKGKSLWGTVTGVDLSMGSFHSGTTFDGKITLDSEQHEELKTALREGYTPSFIVMKGE